MEILSIASKIKNPVLLGIAFFLVITNLEAEVMHNYPIADLAEMLKEEFGELKLCMKPKLVQCSNTSITSWFVKLYLEVDADRLYSFFLVRVKCSITKPEFTLVVKVIFNREKSQTYS